MVVAVLLSSTRSIALMAITDSDSSSTFSARIAAKVCTTAGRSDDEGFARSAIIGGEAMEMDEEGTDSGYDN